MSLFDGLIAYWKLNESSGDALDAHASFDLVESGFNDVGADTGLIVGSRTFGGSAALLDVDPYPLEDEMHGDIPLTLAGWLWIDDPPQEDTDQTIWSRWTAAGSGRSFSFWYDYSENRLKWTVSGNGTTGTTATASNYGNVPAGQWIRFKLWHDPVAKVIGIKIGDAAANTASHSTGIAEGNLSSFGLGWGTTGADVTDLGLMGRLDEVGVWGRVWDSTDDDDHWNDGDGRPYESFEPFAGTAAVEIAAAAAAEDPDFAGSAAVEIGASADSHVGTAAVEIAAAAAAEDPDFAGSAAVEIGASADGHAGTAAVEISAAEVRPDLEPLTLSASAPGLAAAIAAELAAAECVSSAPGLDVITPPHLDGTACTASAPVLGAALALELATAAATSSAPGLAVEIAAAVPAGSIESTSPPPGGTLASVLDAAQTASASAPAIAAGLAAELTVAQTAASAGELVQTLATSLPAATAAAAAPTPGVSLSAELADTAAATMTAPAPAPRLAALIDTALAATSAPSGLAVQIRAQLSAMAITAAAPAMRNTKLAPDVELTAETRRRIRLTLETRRTVSLLSRTSGGGP